MDIPGLNRNNIKNLNLKKLQEYLETVKVKKVPKCETFDRQDFRDFYTIKSLWEGDFGVKIKKYLKNIWGREIPYAPAQSNFKGTVS